MKAIEKKKAILMVELDGPLNMVDKTIKDIKHKHTVVKTMLITSIEYDK